MSPAPPTQAQPRSSAAPPPGLAGVNALLVHYWLVKRRGGEVVLEALRRLLPQADILSHVIDPKVLFGALEGGRAQTTFISKLPAARRLYQAYLPLMPVALEMADVSSYDLIVSSEAGPAKWVIPRPDAKHVCYCHSPMRYLWDQRFIYQQSIPRLLRPLAHMAFHGLRNSDVLSSMRVDRFAANSRFVAQRINTYYRREAEVIHPPVDVEDYSAAPPEDFYLCAGEIRNYKRLDLAIQACERLKRRLIIVGSGAQDALKPHAGKHTTFLGRVDQAELRSLMSRCRALLFPGVEDFGIIPVEVMASGRPVIAYGYGGALDTVELGVSGLLFEQQDVDCLCATLLDFESDEGRFTAQACQASASRFSRGVFEAKMRDLCVDVLSQ